jgi:peroxiredoxin
MVFGKKRPLPAVGVQVSDFRLPRLDGGEANLREMTQRGPALLVFFKVNCPVCQLTFPYLERIHSPERLPIYGISQNGPEDTREFMRQYGVTFPMLLDSEKSGFAVSNALGISSVPTLFLVEADGSLSRVIEGWRKSEIERLGAQAGVNPFRPEDSVPEWKAG